MRRPRFFLNTILGVVIGAAACSGDTAGPAEPSVPSYGLIGDLTGGVTGTLSAVLLQCSPLPYSASTKAIGPDGGVLQVGPHYLVVPRGALSSKVTIKGEVVSGSANSVRFSPDGLRFAKSAALTMSYSNCSGLGMLLRKKIVYTNELLNILEIVSSIDLSSQKTVVGQLDHFSRYAVAY